MSNSVRLSTLDIDADARELDCTTSVVASLGRWRKGKRMADEAIKGCHLALEHSGWGIKA